MSEDELIRAELRVSMLKSKAEVNTKDFQTWKCAHCGKEQFAFKQFD